MTRDWECRQLADDIVQTVYRAFIVNDGDGSGTFSRRSSLWRLENGCWKMVFHQGTRVDPFELQPS